MSRSASSVPASGRRVLLRSHVDAVFVWLASHRRCRAGARIAVAPAAALALAVALQTPAPARTLPPATLVGRVVSGATALGVTPVRLYRAASRGGRTPVLLGTARTGADGSFSISYRRQSAGGVLYLLAGRGAAVKLASAFPSQPVPTRVVVNERTTVATGFALAQFIAGSGIAGKAPGVQNAAAMVGDLVDVRTGALSRVLLAKPNGNQTSTLRTFNSLANILVPCARSSLDCGRLFRSARPPRGPAPQGTLAAVADIASNPWHNVGRLFSLTRAHPAMYRPALGPSGRPDAWILALRFYGDGKTMSGPGNMAIDARGDIWSTNNYDYSRNPHAAVCGSNLLLEFTPTGQYVAGSPFAGGGLNGAGFGITLDPAGHVWVGNYGFAADACDHQPPHNSVSEFTPNGRPLSLDPAGFTQGGISWPQGTVSDQRGNIWIANCGNNTVTRYTGGEPGSPASFAPPGLQRPFDIAFNGQGQAFVTGNGNSSVAMLNPDGTPARSLITGAGLSGPLGIAADSKGDMWVSNTGKIDITCQPGGGLIQGTPSVTLIDSNGMPRARPFTGGGIVEPWGIAVDGHDNVWVSNFNGQRVAELCGIEPANCPPGKGTGQQISPARTGYGFDGLTRNTGIQIDPSGNVWIADNWKNHPLPFANPGGYYMVAYIGLAGPVRTPLIGPPRPL